MWFPLALTAMLMLVVRRSTEKTLADKIPATSMAWLQQFVALPFILLAFLLPAAVFLNPLGLSQQFYAVLVIYAVLSAADVILYFKAISLGDISVIASTMSLTVVSSLIGSYFILSQVPSAMGIAGSVCILVGAYLATKRPPSADALNTAANKLALVLILGVVILRGIYGPLEVIGINESNPYYFNLATSLVAVPIIMLVMYWRGRNTGKPAFSKSLLSAVKTHRIGLLIIGVTYTINLTCTFTAKVMAENAGYIPTVKSASVLPVMILGVLLFREKVRKRQWLGLGIIIVGLALFSRA